jgi:2-deoxy-D-gluconate 3-dehydrogenase
VNRSFDLTGRVAAITGANTGLGRAIAEALAGAGADVACIGRSDPAETLATLGSQGRRGHWVNADLGSKPDYAGIVGDVVAKLGGLDILVNNAGIIRRNNSIDFTEADWDAVIDVNLKAAFFLSRRVAARSSTSRRCCRSRAASACRRTPRARAASQASRNCWRTNGRAAAST